jgi:hypothetical protein
MILCYWHAIVTSTGQFFPMSPVSYVVICLFQAQCDYNPLTFIIVKNYVIATAYCLSIVYQVVFPARLSIFTASHVSDLIFTDIYIRFTARRKSAFIHDVLSIIRKITDAFQGNVC